MSEHRWTLIDAAAGLCEDQWHKTAGDVADPSGNWRISQRTLHGGLSEGVQLVEIDNGRMKLSVLPTRGMGVWRAEMADRSLGWKSPVRGPVHPSFVPLEDPSGLGWLEGFDELMCRCGLESNGAPAFNEHDRLQYGLHGRIANRPAHHVELSVDEATGVIQLRGVVEETRFHFQKLRLTSTITTCVGSSSFCWHDEVENFGGTPASMQMLYHVNIGQPWLEPGAQLVAPVEQVAPNAVSDVSTPAWNAYGPPQPGAAEQVYFFRLRADDAGETQVLLKNPAGDGGVGLQFNQKQLPCFTVWKNSVAEADGYVTGIEPATNFPNPRPLEESHGRIIALHPGARWQAEVTLDWLTSAAEVSRAEEAIAQLQGASAPIVHARPRQAWSEGV